LGVCAFERDVASGSKGRTVTKDTKGSWEKGAQRQDFLSVGDEMVRAAMKKNSSQSEKTPTLSSGRKTDESRGEARRGRTRARTLKNHLDATKSARARSMNWLRKKQAQTKCRRGIKKEGGSALLRKQQRGGGITTQAKGERP